MRVCSQRFSTLATTTTSINVQSVVICATNRSVGSYNHQSSNLSSCIANNSSPLSRPLPYHHRHTISLPSTTVSARPVGSSSFSNGAVAAGSSHNNSNNSNSNNNSNNGSFPTVTRPTTIEDIRSRDPYLPILCDPKKEKLTWAYWMRRLSRMPFSWHYARETLMNIDKQASRDEFFTVIGLPREFPQEQALRVLHLWMVTLRLNSEEYNRRDLAYMFDLFWGRTEANVMKVPGMSVLILNRTMADIQQSSFGALAAYDVTLDVHRQQHDDAPLCGALYRNLWGSARKSMAVPKPRLIQLKNYVLRNIAHMHTIPVEKFYSGKITWLPPASTPPTTAEEAEARRLDLVWHEAPLFNNTPIKGYDWKNMENKVVRLPSFLQK
jgi:hypothetical protein